MIQNARSTNQRNAETGDESRSSTHAPTIHPFAGLIRSTANLAGDLIELGELQTSLAKEDTKLVVRRAIFPAGMLVLGFTGLLAGLPLLGMALSSWFVEALGWAIWFSHLVSGLSLIALAAMSFILGYYGLKGAIGSYSRSSQELANNLEWIKSLIRSHSGD